MSVNQKINTNQSVKGEDLLSWINADKSTKTEEEQSISNKLYHKYVVDRNGNPKKKIYPDVFYYVNYNNKFNPDVFLPYIVRDKTKSPRSVPESLANMNLVESTESHKGGLIQEWAYHQNGNSEHPYYIEGCDIVTRYLEGNNCLRKHVYYFVVRTAKGIKIFRDLDKSPRETKPVT